MELPDPTKDQKYQRIRTSYDIVATPVHQERTYADCVNQPRWTTTGSQGSALNGTSRSMVDWVVPRFVRKQKRGEKFFNDMFKEVVTVGTVGSGSSITAVPIACGLPGVHAQWKDVGGPTVQNWIPAVAANSHGHRLPVLNTVLDDAEILRIQKIVSTEVIAKQGTTGPELWEGVAQYREAIGLLENPLSRLKGLSSRLLQSAQRDRLGRGLLSEVSAGYLMYRYGVLSAMQDIKTILSSLSKTTGQQEVTSRAKEQLFAQKLTTGNTNDGLENVFWRCQSSDSVTVRGMSLDLGDVSFANNLGFSMKGFAMLPLQLTSYSFVADWFSNLSSFVQSTLPVLGWKHLGSCLVTTRQSRSLYEVTGFTNLQPSTYSFNVGPNGSMFIDRVTTTRSALLPASFEIVSDFKFDKFTRVADAAALVASRFVRVGGLVGPSPNNSAFRNKKAYQNWADTLNFSSN